MRLSRRVFGTLAVALLLAACGSGSASGSAGQASGSATPGALRVVTTTTVFANIVKNVGGDRTSVTSIIPPGVGPEDYEPKPDDARK